MAGSTRRLRPDLPAPDADAPVVEVLGKFLRACLKPAVRVCVGLSGGVDSVVLLHALSRCLPSSTRERDASFQLSAVHVHHGIAPEADAWEAFCRDYCARLDVPLRVVHVTVARDSGEGLEAAARRQRYEAFAEIDADWLALAHHRGDQAETVLLNLLRGAGVTGAAGMPVTRTPKRGPRLVRPLLALDRELIAGYARRHGLTWVDDDSNNDRHFRRNFLRHEILPRLEEKMSGANRALARAAGHFAEAGELLDDLAALDRTAVASPSGRMTVQGLARLKAARGRNLLRYAWTSEGFRAPDERWINEALKQLAVAKPSSEICLSTADGELHVYRGEVYLRPQSEDRNAEAVEWTGQTSLPWAGGRVNFEASSGQGLRRSALDGAAVMLKARQGGERLQPDARRPRRAVRKLLQENGVPPWERARLPLLWVDDCLAWVGGIACDAGFACAPGEEGLLPVWEHG